MAECKLCREEKELCKSHVIPEFFFKPTYDEKHRGTVFQIEPNKKYFIQKGYREKLFCKECESKFSKYENYVAEEWYQKNAIPIETQDDIIRIEGLDYTLFKLFHLSILFRASASSLSEYEQIKLGPHQEKIRQLILNDDPGHINRYTFFGLYLTHENKRIDSFIMQPISSKINAHKAYVFFFGGVQWNYIVSNHTPTEFLDFLYTGDTLILAKEKFTDNPYVKDFAKDFNKST